MDGVVQWYLALASQNELLVGSPAGMIHLGRRSRY